MRSNHFGLIPGTPRRGLACSTLDRMASGALSFVRLAWTLARLQVCLMLLWTAIRLTRHGMLAFAASYVLPPTDSGQVFESGLILRKKISLARKNSTLACLQESRPPESETL